MVASAYLAKSAKLLCYLAGSVVDWCILFFLEWDIVRRRARRGLRGILPLRPRARKESLNYLAA